VTSSWSLFNNQDDARSNKHNIAKLCMLKHAFLMKSSFTFHSKPSHYLTQWIQDVHINTVLSWPVTKCLSDCKRPLEPILNHLVYEGVFRKKSWNE